MKRLKLTVTFLVCFLLSASGGVYNEAAGTANALPAVKEITAEASKEVLVSGRALGIVMNTDGVIITKVSDVTDAQNEKHFPAADAGLRAGDIIKAVNGKKIQTTEELVAAIEENGSKELSLRYERAGNTLKTRARPVIDATSNEYKLGILVRDGASGIGTLTYIDPETGSYGCLGHPITEASTGVILPVKSGKTAFATVTGAIKGKQGTPGELQGTFGLKRDIGTVELNNEYGLFGSISDEEAKKDCIRMKVAKQSELKTGEAEILCTVDGEKPERYSIKITRLNSQSTKGTKGMTIEVTDPRLIEKTGGIVQGMSGSPIIQNGKLAGAVTHVTVNDPTKGYGIYIEWMLEESTRQAA